MRLAIFGRKLGMTQFFTDANTVVPVTVIEAGPCPVLQKKTMEKDQYSAIQVGFMEKKESRCTKPILGHFKAAGVTPRRYVREIRLNPGEEKAFEIGQELKVDIFSDGDRVDVIGTSKGKGFQGVMKRHNFVGNIGSHGTHEYFRHGGSIGCRLTPGRTWPGKRMGGHMGDVRVTTQNLTVFRVDAEKNLIFIRGAVPGAPNSLVEIVPAVKAKKGKK